MCKSESLSTATSSQITPPATKPTAPQQTMKEPTLLARYTSLGIILAMFSIWAKFTFVPESSIPGVHTPMHSYKTPLALTVFYLISLPLLRLFATTALKGVDTKVLLKESMVFYNVAQVGLNGWMVYRMVDALVYRGHFFIGDLSVTESGATFAVWVHYCDKYLEFFDTYFMVLRGRMDQVSFLHIYHHVTIAWAWWAAINLCPGGDIYFGALFNSWIHVMMYSYYALALLKYPFRGRGT
jgi:elongation of very long chain fatty acids protein 4